MPRPAKITTQEVERNVQLQRILDVQRRELSAFADENNKLLNASNAQAKIDIRRRESQQQACRTEQQYEEKIQREEFEKRLKEKTIMQNQAIATELDREIAEEERKRREMQRICEESPELRELERALKIAYLNRERAVQFEEKVLLAQREHERMQAIDEQMEYDRLRAIKQESDKQGGRKAMFEDQRAVLLKQIADRNEQLAEARRQTDRDRQMVDDIVRKIYQEDEADMKRKREMQSATAKMMRDFEAQRRREVEAAKAAAKAEEDAIMAYNKSVADRGAGIEAKKQAKKDEEDRILAKIVEETERKRKEEEEFSNLRDMLWEEELEAARAKDAAGRKEKREFMKREMMEANDAMLIKKKEIRLKEAEEEARILTLMRNKFAADEAKEKAEEEFKRRQKMQYMNQVEKQRQGKKQLYDAERAAELSYAEEAERREQYRKQVIQEARRRLLEEHAAKLQGFLPGNVFESSEEFENFKRAASSQIH